MLYALLAIAVALTFAMFSTRQVMLGFPCVIFWAIMGGHCYGQSATTWDTYYLLFFASMGMAIFSAIAMYGLRAEDLAGPDADEGEFFDEGKEPDLRGDVEVEAEEGGEKLSERARRLRSRADKRRSG